MKTWKTQGVVLKRVRTGDGDWVLTTYTEDRGKLVLYVRGARKLLSKKGSSLEPGNLISVQVNESNSLPYLNEVKTINEYSRLAKNLFSAKRLFQVLEMIDVLTVEQDSSSELYALLIQALSGLESGSSRESIKNTLFEMLRVMGYFVENKESSIASEIQKISDKPMKSFTFLTVYNKTL